MSQELFGKLLDNLKGTEGKIPDTRTTGHNFRYMISDALLSAFAVFFFQHPSLLDFAKAMREKKKKDNLQTVFGAVEIPSSPQIRDILDKIEPDKLSGVFVKNLKEANNAGILREYRVLDGGVLLAVDGVWYYSSDKVHCPRCLSITKNGETTYYHSALAATIVKPGSNEVIPVMPEMIANGDSENGNNYEKQKQDCEIKAFKRWLEKNLEALSFLRPTLLGDDLYSNYPLCKMIMDMKCDFIFTCKPKSHPWLTEYIEADDVSVKEERVWDKKSRSHMIRRYKWANEAEIRYENPTLMVNWLYFEIENEKTGEKNYCNSWITNKNLNEDNVEKIAECGRARWKIENEHNNVLKNHGYNLKHNFGHGENHASEIFCTLNLLAFMFHTLLSLGDETYSEARQKAGRREKLFQKFQMAFEWFLFGSWQEFITFILRGPPDG